MPSSPNYVRQYDQEAKTSAARGEKKDNAARHRARRLMVKKGMVKKFDGKDVDHKTPLSKGGAATAPKNLRVVSASSNRSFPRKPSGAMK